MDTTSVDPVTTEVVRHGLIAATDAMKHTLVRTSMTPTVYDSHDFTAVLYDDRIRLLAQAPSQPLMMGTMGHCVEAAVAAVGGPEALRRGDVVLLNDPYKTGSHAQDAAVVAPVFLEDSRLAGYAAIKSHWPDIGAKNPYCTDTTDLFQEGVVFPGVFLYRAGELVTDVRRIVIANSRLPRETIGDIEAAVAAVRTGAKELVRLIGRYGFDIFSLCVERMYDHGEAMARDYLSTLPDGRYVGRGELDSDGISDEPIPFEIAVEIDGSNVRVDFTNVPDARPGPVNCPLPSTVSAARMILSMLAGGGESPNEGVFRPIEVVTRPGSMFHPEPPAPSFLYFQPLLQAMEVILHALGMAVPEAVPACSGGDVNGVSWYGNRAETGEFWIGGDLNPVGQGASSRGDGAHTLMHHGVATSRPPSVEILEAKYPWITRHCELAPDSGGAGRFSGGLGRDISFEYLEDVYMVSVFERSKNPPWGLAGGEPGRANSAELRLPDGTVQPIGKVTGMFVPKGSLFTFRSGGGGGYGPPAGRAPETVRADVREGYITEDYARRHYPHAMTESGVPT